MSEEVTCDLCDRYHKWGPVRGWLRVARSPLHDVPWVIMIEFHTVVARRPTRAKARAFARALERAARRA